MIRKTNVVFFALFLLLCTHSFATIYTVTNTNDAGLGSLRDAIIQANTNIGADTIHFNIGGAGVKTITMGTVAMSITDTLFIDGSSEPGYTGLPLIEINGNGISRALGITATASYSKIHAIAVNRVSYMAIQSYADYFTITGCHIGVDPAGTTVLQNGFAGLGIYNSSHVRVGGLNPAEANLIGGNSMVGIGIYYTDSSTVIGNKIGTDISGTISLQNGQGVGVFHSKGVTIGGNTPAHRNIISGNGIGIQFYISDSCYVQGNYIGTDISGSFALPNYANGIYARGDHHLIGGTLTGEGNLISGNGGGITLFSGAAQGDTTFNNKIYGNLIGTDATGTQTIPNRIGISVNTGVQRTEIGGTSLAHRNVISGNTTNGIQLGIVDSTVIYGNLIGTDITGTQMLGNQSYGITMGSSVNTYVGDGTLAGANVISANGRDGIYVLGTDSIYIRHNYIGTDVSGTLYLPNTLNGINVRSSATHTLIGSTNANEGNVIANNLRNGIEVNGAATTSNQILGNSIYDHPNPGIVLSGGNNNQAAPDITGYAGNLTSTIFGTFTSAPNTTYRLEFFTSPTSAQGKTFMGYSDITTDALGNYLLNETFPVAINANEPIITATATDPNGNTSAFGAETILELDSRDSLSFNQVNGFTEFKVLHENPMSSKSTISISTKEKRSIHLYLLDTQGKMIRSFFEGELQKDAIHKFSIVDVETLSRGMYLLVIEGEDIRLVKKIMFEE